MDGSDPDGLDWVDATANYFAGWGDTLTFGATKYCRRCVGEIAGVGDANDAVNYNSCAYLAGIVTGSVHSTAMGKFGGSGLEAANGLLKGMSRFNAAFPKGVEWVEESHWIPRRLLPNSLKDAAWNVKRMWGTDHALCDPYRYKFL